VYPDGYVVEENDMAKARAKRGQVELVFRTHGGKRPGAGRKPKGTRAGASHRTRPEHDPRHPVHVTLRIVGSAAGLRCKDMYLAIREATIVSAKREDFRLVQMSIQRDHLHLIVEASSRAALSSGIRGFSISAARQINKAYTERGGDRRTGRVFADRYHARPLTSPRAVRNCLAYCLSNWRHHGEDRAPTAQSWKVDPYSSGALFPGWQELAGSPFFWPLPPKYLPLIVLRPCTWLLQNWDRFSPLISVREVPGHH
jgi:REP element-mobilizing transposase RayT